MEMVIRRLSTWIETDNDLELYHHGVKGQRWGVRRYQNEDGTLTPAGAKRLGRHQQRYSKYAEKIYGKYSKRMQKKADKFVTKLNTTDKNIEPNKYEKLKKKQEHFQNRADFGKQHMELAMKKIENLTLEDVQKDKAEHGRYIATALLLSPMVASLQFQQMAYNRMNRIGVYDTVAASTDKDIKMANKTRRLYGDIGKR